MKLEGKVVMISGGSKGLGAALAHRFADEGARLSLCARGGSDLADMGDELVERGAEVLTLAADISKEEDVQAWIEATLDRFGQIDVLVNNASLLGPRVGIEEYPPSEWRKVHDVNLTGAFLCARAAIPALRASKGSMIHVSSGVGDHGRPYWGAYCTSKNGLEALSEILAGELEGDGVRSNAVDPGSMRTEMRAAAYPEEDPDTLPTPAELTDVFVYLACEESGDVSGQRFRAKEFAGRV